MNMDNTEVSFFSSECALFEYAIKDNDNFLEKCLILAWWVTNYRPAQGTNVRTYIHACAHARTPEHISKRAYTPLTDSE